GGKMRRSRQRCSRRCLPMRLMLMLPAPRCAAAAKAAAAATEAAARTATAATAAPIAAAATRPAATCAAATTGGYQIDERRNEEDEHADNRSRPEAAGEIAGLELRRDVFVDDTLGGSVGQRAFEAIADLDPQAAIVLGDDEQRAVVDLLAADLPGFCDPERELLDRLAVRRRYDQHRDLAAL